MSLKPVDPSSVALDKISEMLSARGLDAKHAAAWIESADSHLSVSGKTLLFDGIPIDNAVKHHNNFFGDVPRPVRKMTQEDFDSEREKGIRHPDGSVEIIENPELQVPQGAKMAGIATMKDKALLLIRAELRSRSLPDDIESARAFLSMHSDKLNFNDAGDSLRYGARPMSVQMSNDASLLAPLQTPRVKMTQAQWNKLHYARLPHPPLSNVEFEG